MVVLKSKRVSYGVIQLVDAGTTSPRYRILVNDTLHEVSDDLNFMMKTFNEKYY